MRRLPLILCFVLVLPGLSCCSRASRSSNVFPSLPASPPTEPLATPESRATAAEALPESPVTSTPAPESKPLNKAEEIALKIEKDVEKLRGLPFKEPVKIGVYDKTTLKAFLLKAADKELNPARIEPYARGLKALALIPQDMDFRKTLLEILNEQIAGFYDPDTKELRLIDRSAPTAGESAESKKTSAMEKMAKAMMERLGVDEDSVIMAHELTHALQDQHVGLKTLPLEVTDDDDLVIASQAVVEGDATLAMMGWMFLKMGMPTKRLFSKTIASTLDQTLDLSSIPGADAVADAPAFIKEGLLFPYVGGLKFCVIIASESKSFAPVDRALKTPPLSTEQIIHPEKYTGAGPDFPTALALPDLSEALGMPKLTSNTLGELNTRILLAEKIDDKDRTTAAAAGWDGDRYVLYGKPGAPDALVWVSTWDSSEEADEFEGSLKSWLGALNAGKASEESDVTSARFLRGDGTLDAIARKGSDVILVRGVPKDRLIAVLQKIFEETTRSEKEEGVISCERLAFEDALIVYESSPTEELREAATAVRNRHNDPCTATYLVDRNINYTNVCITDCSFCEFFRPPGHAESYVLTREQLGKKVQELVDAGGTRILMQGGHNPDLRIGWYEDLLRWLSTSFPTIEIDAFSPSEIEHLADLERFTTADTLRRLKEAGLRGLPGGGGEILDDEIRDRVSPKKTKTAAWLRIMGEAHALGLSTTVTMVFGFGEEPAHRLRAFENIRRRQDESLARFGRGFLAFASWPLQFESRYGQIFAERKGWKLGASCEEYLRHTAFARLYLDNVPHFQASWPTMGLPCAERALTFGCDDMGGTMMEENVVSQAGSTHCSMTEADLRAAITRARFVPRKRDTAYSILA